MIQHSNVGADASANKSKQKKSKLPGAKAHIQYSLKPQKSL